MHVVSAWTDAKTLSTTAQSATCQAPKPHPIKQPLIRQFILTPPEIIAQSAKMLGTCLDLSGCRNIFPAELQNLFQANPNFETIDVRGTQFAKFSTLLSLIPKEMHPQLRRIRTDDIDIRCDEGDVISLWKKTVSALGIGPNVFLDKSRIAKMEAYDFSAFKNIDALICQNFMNDELFIRFVNMETLAHLKHRTFTELSPYRISILRSANLSHLRSIALHMHRDFNVHALSDLCHTAWLRKIRHLTVTRMPSDFLGLWVLSRQFPRQLTSFTYKTFKRENIDHTIQNINIRQTNKLINIHRNSM